MIGKVVLLVTLVVFVSLAIMFDWFGSRELAEKGVSGAQEAVEKLQDTGDSVSQTIESMTDKEDR